MIEVKFRAWYKKENKMYSVLEISWIRNTITIDKSKKKGKWKVPYIIFLDDVKLMQYTGLKDKNGKEIYEGDIVKFEIYLDYTDETPTEVVREVKWYDDGWRPGDWEDEDAGDWVDWDKMEVIDNIYKNPTLLK